MTAFNFDEWAQLFKEDPEAFERKRKEVLEAEILKAPVQRRSKLRLIQMECDVIREVHSPLVAASEISKMMMDKMYDLQDSMMDLVIAAKEINERR